MLTDCLLMVTHVSNVFLQAEIDNILICTFTQKVFTRERLRKIIACHQFPACLTTNLLVIHQYKGCTSWWTLLPEDK